MILELYYVYSAVLWSKSQWSVGGFRITYYLRSNRMCELSSLETADAFSHIFMTQKTNLVNWKVKYLLQGKCKNIKNDFITLSQIAIFIVSEQQDEVAVINTKLHICIWNVNVNTCHFSIISKMD